MDYTLKGLLLGTQPWQILKFLMQMIQAIMLFSCRDHKRNSVEFSVLEHHSAPKQLLLAYNTMFQSIFLNNYDCNGTSIPLQAAQKFIEQNTTISSITEVNLRTVLVSGLENGSKLKMNVPVALRGPQGLIHGDGQSAEQPNLMRIDADQIQTHAMSHEM